MKGLTAQRVLVAAVIAAGLALLILRFVFFQPFDVPSESMSPTLNQGDYFLASLRAFSRRDPERGDVIVFSTPKGDFVKRIAGIPGDRVQMVDGRLVLNGKPVTLRRIEDFSLSGASDDPHPVRQYIETLPSGRSYATLDLVAASALDNTPVFVVPPDRYFVMGDNRDNSNDSRLELGFIARRDLRGRVAVKFIDGRRHALSWAKVD